MKKRFTIASVLAAISILALLVACGGGGDGSGDNPTKTTNTQKLDQANVDEALQSIEDILPFCEMNGASQASATALRSIIHLGQEVASQVEVIHPGRTVIAAVTDESPDPIPGTCPTDPGELTVELLADDVTHTFTGGIDFNAFCAEIDDSEEINIDGGGTFSGTINESDIGELLSVTLNFSTTGNGIDIITPEEEATVAVSGFSLEIESNANGTSGSVSISADSIAMSVGADSVTVSDLSITAAFTDTTVTISASGTMDDSDEGTITLNITGLTVDSDGNLSSGEIVIQGANGTSVTITPVTGNDFEIEADTDGDGSPDYFPGVMTCEEDLLSDISLF